MKTPRKNPSGSFPASFRTQGGFTIIELMVAAFIGLLVLMAVSYAFVGGRHTYVLNSEMMRMQENARAVLETIRRDARMAAFHGCAKIDEVTNLSSRISAEEFARFKEGGIYVQNGGYAGAMSGMSYSGGLEIHGVRANAAEASVQKEFIANNDNTISIAGGALASQFMADDYSHARVLLSDCTGGVFMNLVGAGADTLSVSSSGGDSAQLFARGAQVFLYALPRTFRVQESADAYEGYVARPIGSLYYNEGGLAEKTDPEELARGVEAFRVCLVAGDNKLKPWQTATADEKKNAMQAQVDLVLVSQRPEVLPEVTSYKMRMCGETDPDTVSYEVLDRRLRRLFSATIALRNKITDINKPVEAHDSAAD
ncbi:MAG: prepilin-type N-terminal cleavage/methylation domain-containing protein [Zoogloeaceae bacterium]|jgi:type II secretory pathway component PulJ|nr:prepilin-type N-terminal cleavage/methylation domain-containing protein [Zoogloeaceae bacterium]